MANINITGSNFTLPSDYDEDYDFYAGYANVSGTSSNDVITVEPPAPKTDEEEYYEGYYYALTVDAGEGNDKITLKKNVKIFTYDDVDYGIEDTISNYLISTIKGGKGNDTMIIGNPYADINLIYEDGDGKDIVSLGSDYGSAGFAGDIGIQLKSGSISNYKISGNDHILTIGSGSINLKNMKNVKCGDGRSHVYLFTTDGDIVYINGKKYNNIWHTYPNDDEPGEDYYYYKGTSDSDFFHVYENDDDDYTTTIRGGKGNDYIIFTTYFMDDDAYYGKYDNAPVIQYKSGDGNDSVYIDNFYWHHYDYDDDDDYVKKDYYLPVKLQITDNSSYSTIKSGKNLVVKVGSGSITFEKALGYDGNNYKLEIERTNLPLDPGELPEGLDYTANNTILTASKSFIGTEIDLDNFESTVSVVNAAAVKNSVNLVGNDLDNNIKSGAKNDTLSGGTGSDTLTGGKGNDLFIYSSGNDVITDYATGDDTIMLISDETITGSSLDGKNVILTVGNASSDSIGSLTLNNAKGKRIKIAKSATDVILPVIYGDGDATMNIANGDTSIVNDSNDKVNANGLVTVIDAGKTTKGKQIIHGSTSNIWLKGGKKNDTLSGNYGDDTLTGGGGKDVFIYDGHGKDVVTDYASGQDTIKLESGSASNYTVSGKDIVFQIDSDNYLTVKNGLNKKITIKDSEDVITNNIYNDPTEKVLTNSDSATVDVSNENKIVTINATKRSKAVEIIGNSNDNIIKGSSKNDTLDGGEGDDVLTGGKGKDLFIYSGGDDTITDYTVGQDRIQMAMNMVVSFVKIVDNTDYVFSIRKYLGGTSSTVNLIDVGTLTVKNGVITKGKKTTAKKIDITEPNNISWYYYNTLQSSQVYGEYAATLNIGNTDYQAIHTESDGKITVDTNQFRAGVNNDYFQVVDASKRSAKYPINIRGNGNDNIIKGGAGNDTLDDGSAGTDDTLAGGKGKDIFEVYGGDDIVTDYAAGQDTIIAQDKIFDSSIQGNDVVLFYNDVRGNKSSITLKKTKGKAITTYAETDDVTILSSSSRQYKPHASNQIYGNGASTLIASSDETSINSKTVGNFDLVKMLDASKLKVAVEITGNNNGNVIKGGSAADTLIGGSGDDTFTGEKGDDTLTGGNGADVFVYNSGDGNDVIADFTSSDKIMLGNKKTKVNESKSAVSGNDYILTIGSNTITIKNAADKAITVVDSKGNSKTYNSQASYLERECFTDENFSSTELDSILDNSSNLINNDYNYNFNQTWNKQLNQTLVTNSIKQAK